MAFNSSLESYVKAWLPSAAKVRKKKFRMPDRDSFSEMQDRIDLWFDFSERYLVDLSEKSKSLESRAL